MMWRAAIAAGLWVALSAAHATGTLGKQVNRANAPSLAPITSVRSLFVVHCAGCHGVDGAGSVIGGVPDMRQLGQFLQLEGGREFIVSVPGVMNAGLNDEQIASVTNWVLATLASNSLPAGYRPFVAHEIAQTRRQPLVDVAATRARLIEQARAKGLALR